MESTDIITLSNIFLSRLLGRPTDISLSWVWESNDTLTLTISSVAVFEIIFHSRGFWES